MGLLRLLELCLRLMRCGKLERREKTEEEIEKIKILLFDDPPVDW